MSNGEAASAVAPDETDAVTAIAAAEPIAEPADSSPASSGEDGEPPLFDPDAESAFLAEARERGELNAPRPVAGSTEVEETDPKALPRLEELVDKIPAEVRETLDELFRARFVTVKRVPKRALKSS